MITHLYSWNLGIFLINTRCFGCSFCSCGVCRHLFSGWHLSVAVHCHYSLICQICRQKVFILSLCKLSYVNIVISSFWGFHYFPPHQIHFPIHQSAFDTDSVFRDISNPHRLPINASPLYCRGLTTSLMDIELLLKEGNLRASLVAQWWKIYPPMQETWVWSLIWEDLTCHGATKYLHHNYWACALDHGSHNYWSPHPGAHAPQEKAPQREALSLQLDSSPSSLQLEKSLCSNEDPAEPKMSKNYF